ncbi:VanZ family protein [Jiangella asiatica]|uniref:VanZ family protein n=1 Tax=Jiangella asiatica TaxID=2530372 RepID=A0A4R5DTR3_9ACTN|nr:VanZ family protein [Jiangella asiatica]TDE14283.1 VanZ family protein [Jiangella asiatica]
MISTILVEHPWLTTVALTGLIIVGPLVGAWLVPRSRVTLALLGVSMVPVLLLTLVPTSRELKTSCAIEWDFPTLGAVELMGNVVLFTPVVLFAAALTRRPFLMFLAASGLSLLIEVFQAFATALGRSCSTNDWLSNTLGALLGAVLAAAALRLAQRSAPRGAPQDSRTTRSQGMRRNS